MYVEPNSTIILCKDVPIDSSYTNTLYFKDRDSQFGYFRNLQKHYLTNNTYVRKGYGRIRVGLPIRAVYDCNYMCYNNIDEGGTFENKWFYAFILSTEYVNNNTTDITFQIDVLQTWMFDYKINYAYIDRCHADHDQRGDNLVPEDFELGDYVFDKVSTFENIFENMVIVVAHTLNGSGTGTTVHGGMVGGMYSGLTFDTYYPSGSDVTKLNNFLQTASENNMQDGIVSIFMCPEYFVKGNGGVVKDNELIYPANNVNGYLPHNQKLLTYPYVGLYITNNQGSELELKYEYFIHKGFNGCQLRLVGSAGSVPDAVLFPVGYMNNDDTESTRLATSQYCIEITGYPQCAWNTDGYAAWLAKNQPYLTAAGDAISAETAYRNAGLDIAGNADKANTINSVQNRMTDTVTEGVNRLGHTLTPAGQYNGAASLAGAVTYGISSAQALQNASNDIFQYELRNQQRTLDAAYNNQMKLINTEKLMAQKKAARLTPPCAHGTSAGSAKLVNNWLRFTTFRFSITDYFAKKIDNFWDMYGYKQNSLEVPNIHARANWTYMKTMDCSFTGSVPSDDMKLIRTLWDGGVRWWRTKHVGDYSTTNVPTPLD